MKATVFFGNKKYVPIHGMEYDIDEDFIKMTLGTEEVVFEDTEYGTLFFTPIVGVIEQASPYLSELLGRPVWGKGLLVHKKSTLETPFPDGSLGFAIMRDGGRVSFDHGDVRKAVNRRFGSMAFVEEKANGKFHYSKELQIEGRLGNVPLNEYASMIAGIHMYGTVVFEPVRHNFGATKFDNDKIASMLHEHERSMLRNLLNTNKRIHELNERMKNASGEVRESLRKEKTAESNKKRKFLLQLASSLNLSNANDFEVVCGSCAKYVGKGYVSLVINKTCVTTAHFHTEFFDREIVPHLRDIVKRVRIVNNV